MSQNRAYDAAFNDKATAANADRNADADVASGTANVASATADVANATTADASYAALLRLRSLEKDLAGYRHTKAQTTRNLQDATARLAALAASIK
jgi:hypothetical protein